MCTYVYTSQFNEFNEHHNFLFHSFVGFTFLKLEFSFEYLGENITLVRAENQTLLVTGERKTNS